MDDLKKLKIRLANRDRDKKQAQTKRIDSYFRRLGMETSEEREQLRKDELDYDYKQLSRETKQKFLDLMHEGKKVGEAREICGISLDMAS